MAQKIRLVNNLHSHDQPHRQSNEIDVSQKIDALEEAACALVKEVQTLRETCGLRSARHQQDKRGVNYYEEVQRFQVALIKHALEQTKGHQLRAAKLLGISRSTLNALIKRHGIGRYGR